MRGSIIFWNTRGLIQSARDASKSGEHPEFHVALQRSGRCGHCDISAGGRRGVDRRRGFRFGCGVLVRDPKKKSPPRRVPGGRLGRVVLPGPPSHAQAFENDSQAGVTGAAIPDQILRRGIRPLASGDGPSSGAFGRITCYPEIDGIEHIHGWHASRIKSGSGKFPHRLRSVDCALDDGC